MNKFLFIVTILLTVTELIFTLIALLYNPEALPELLIKSCIVIACLLVLLSIWLYISNKDYKDWRINLAQFLLLFFCLIVGFAGCYYFIGEQFKVTPGADIERRLMEAEMSVKQKEIPKFSEEALKEYEKWHEIEREMDGINILIGQIFSRRLNEDIPYPKYLPEDPEPLYEEYENLKKQQEKLDSELINNYKSYLNAARSAKQAAAEVQKYSYFNFLFFSTTITTVGYADMAPITRYAKGWVLAEIIIGSFLILFYLTLILNSVKP